MMTIFKSGDRAGFHGRAWALAVVMPLTLGLGGCITLETQQLTLTALRFHNSVQSEEKLAAEMQALRADPKKTEWNYLLGEMLLYVPDDYSRQLTADRDTFMGAVVGTFLNTHPEYTYDIMDQAKSTTKPVNREEMEFYKIWNKVWVETVMQSAEAAEMKELYALFQKRIGPYGPFSFIEIRALLKDEAAFVQFINDDNYARRWMLARADDTVTKYSDSQYEAILRGTIPQITIPVLPNTGS